MIDKGLFQKWKNGECTSEERAQIQAYFAQGELSDLEKQLQEDWEQVDLTNQIPEDAKSRIWQRLEKSTEPAKPVIVRRLNPNRRAWHSIAAAVILLISIAGSYWMLGRWIDDPQLVEHTNSSEKAQEITLADGSVVWLNRNSKIRYPENFTDSVRLVQLEGEAFFEVATDSLRPFIVLAGEVQTTVLGTAFNVQAFAKNDKIKVALIEGKVQVAIRTDSIDFQPATILSPGELFTFDKNKQSTTTSQYLENAPYAWRDGIIYFDGAKVQEVANVLENWYNIQLILEDTTRINSELVTRFDATRMTLEQVLDGIAKVTDYRFERMTRKKLLVKPD